MRVTVAQIAEALQGTVEGDGSAEIAGLAGLTEAGAGDLAFLANPRYASAVAETAATAVLVGSDWRGDTRATLIRVSRPDEAFARVPPLLGWRPVAPPPGVHPAAVVHESATLGREVAVGPFTVIEPGVRVGDRTIVGAGCYLGHDTVIGRDCRLYPHVSAREGARIGDRVIIHNGAVIGSDGFGYYREGGAWRKIPQVGVVEIGDDVEIGANVTIDRARFGRTVIGNGVKIDNLVQIAHNVRIGDHTAMAAQVGISGSVIVGRGVQLGGQAGLGGHVTVGDGAVVGAQSGVTKDVAAMSAVSGYPAMPHDKARKMHAHLMRLPELKEKVAQMEKRISELESRARGHGDATA